MILHLISWCSGDILCGMSEDTYGGTRLIRSPREHPPKSPYYPGVRIKRALRKTSQTRFTDTKTKADIFLRQQKVL